MDKRVMMRELRAEKVRRDKFNLLIVGTILLVTILVVCFSIMVSAEETSTLVSGTKYYKSIEIEMDDTLWDIAKEYNPDTSMSTKEYVQELMYVNGLNNDTIYAGESILITYYK